MIVIANPGTHPELAHLAEGFAAVDELRYLTSASWAQDALVQRIASSGPIGRSPVGRGLRRRALPAGVRSQSVRRLAGLHETAFQVARSRGLAAGDRIMFARNRRFQSGASRVIGRLKPDVLVAQYTAARELFQVPGPHLRALNHPIVHHAWMAQQEAAEERENPGWAKYLRGSDLPVRIVDEMRERMDAEIGAADVILVPSAFVRETFIASGVPPEKLLVSNLGADLPRLDAVRPKPLDGPLRVIYAGQVTQRKGVSYLLDAIERVPGAELTVMGHPTADIEEAVRRYPRVRLLPSAPRSELFARLREAHLLALPSLAEGFPLVAVEAMANGTAPILTDAAAADDLIEDGVSGYRVRARSVDDLVAVLQSAVTDRQQVRAAGAAARERAERFSWGAYERRTVDLLQDAASQHLARTRG